MAAGTSQQRPDVEASQSSSLMNSRRGPDAARVLLALSLLLTALAYVNTLRFQFVYDDLPQILNNPRVHSWDHAPRLFVEHVWSQLAGQAGNYYRPLFDLW